MKWVAWLPMVSFALDDKKIASLSSSANGPLLLHFRLQNFVSQIGIHAYLIPILTGPIDEMRKKYGIESRGKKVQDYTQIF